jgi:hypothetical protein
MLLDSASLILLAREIFFKCVLLDIQKNQEVHAIRSATLSGRPLGTDSFISKLEKTISRRLRALPVGRPSKNQKP